MRLSKISTGIALCLFSIAAFAQHGMDERSEKAVHITQGPAIVNNNGNSATLEWTTDRQGANRVQYRRAGSNEAWRKAFHNGGGTHHTLQLTGLRPGENYEYEVLTRDGDVRTRGEFRANGDRRDDRRDRDRNKDRDKDHDKDHDRH